MVSTSCHTGRCRGAGSCVPHVAGHAAGSQEEPDEDCAGERQPRVREMGTGLIVRWRAIWSFSVQVRTIWRHVDGQIDGLALKASNFGVMAMGNFRWQRLCDNTNTRETREDANLTRCIYIYIGTTVLLPASGTTSVLKHSNF